MTHSNTRWPRLLERVVGWVFVTPRIHRFHHHHEVPWTDSNYGNMLSIWDRIFGTYTDGDPDEIVCGLDVADGEKSGELAYQIGLPFNRKVRNFYRSVG
jgi:sterol desaturase/sphingolipid hydroxylase (fatty acid hydroxylase superfamily)